MANTLKAFVSAILAGLSISIGGMVFLSLDNKVIGAFFFTIGLFAVCTLGFNLYTGKVCYVFEKDKQYAINVIIIWFGNLVGTFTCGKLFLMTRFGAQIAEKAQTIAAAKLGDNLLSIFILAIFCNMLIYLGVEGYNKNPHEVGKYLAMVFGVVVFILCGFEHCVANMFYFTVAGSWSIRTFGYLMVMTLGNAVGGVFFPLVRGYLQK